MATAAFLFRIMNKHRKLERYLAVASFIVAAALCFLGLLRSDVNTIEAGVLFACGQFLTLTATILGLDYKFGDVFTQNLRK